MFFWLTKLRLVVASLLLIGAFPAAGSAQQPNILVILADDLGKEGLGFTGDPPAHSTPSLDRLAAEGTVYTSVYAMPTCTPTRAAVLTGLYPRNNGMKGTKDISIDGKCLDPFNPSLARTLSEAGYTTGAAGKWHVCSLIENPNNARDLGFDHFALHVGARPNQPEEARYFNARALTSDSGLVDLGTFGPDYYAAWISEFMATAPEPFFAYWGMLLVHRPFIDPDALEPGNRRNFADMVAYMDRLIGEVVPDNTVVIFLGDNGTDQALGGGKGTAKDSGTNVPMIVWGLGASGPDYRMVSVVDLHATIAEIAGAAAPATDGVSFLTDTRDHVIAYNRGHRMARERQWKIRSKTGDPWKLYHLPSDIKESKPVKSRKGEAGAAFDRLKAIWQAH